MPTIDVEELLSQLTLEEKISLIAGASTWRTTAVSRLGIPNLKVSDGPSGARGQVFGEGVPAAFLPCGVSLGATWDTDLMYELGQLLADECTTKSARVQLAPTMCIHRHPLGGRNFESYSEDPFLTGKLAAAHVRGLQSQGVGATPKHFVANDEETNRFKVNCVIPPRPLHEVYLLPFQMVVRDADPWCMMTAYNKVNGLHCDASGTLLTEIARKAWGWNGVFMSDWGGTTSTAASINAGLDLEMGGPPSHRTLSKVMKAVEEGKADVSQIDISAKRVLQLLIKTGRFEDSSDNPEYCDNTPEKREALFRAASSGAVLLKNERNALPIKPSENLNKVAILGPNSQRVVAGGRGSSYINVPYWTSVYGSLKTRFEENGTEVVSAVGAKVNRYVPTMSTLAARNPDTGKGGGAIDWFLGHDMTGPVQAVTHIEDLYYIAFGNTPREITTETGFSFRFRTILTPTTTGTHQLSLASIGPAGLFIEEELAIQLSGEEKGSLFFQYGSEETIIEKHLLADQEYRVTIEVYSHDRQLRSELADFMEPMEEKFQGFRLGYQEHDERDLPAEAARVARDCDAAVVVVGRDKEWETEGQDIPIFELPGEQVRLIREVATVCKRTIVVVQAGTPVDMLPWIDQVQGVLYAWYQGQELGNSAAAIICGEVNPSGRLPITFPKRIEDCPAFSSFPGEQDEIQYSESLYVGYRWWDLHNTEPLFPIGFGLSYSTFEISDEKLSTNSLLRDNVVIVTAHVYNRSEYPVPGRQTVIAWCSQKSNRRLSRPKKQICGFAKTPPLGAGVSYQIQISIDAYSLALYDPQKAAWVVDKGSQFDIQLGTDAQNSWSVGTVVSEEEIVYVHSI
ncbi:periplasmic beta-glucosidase precursor [Hypoxylon sp. FL1150]|nr:periplasmic beta-glucosidase precursor [Hypoxylon sp. FL1150]